MLLPNCQSILCTTEPNTALIAFVEDLFGITLANSAEPPTSTSLNKKIGPLLCLQGRINLPFLGNHHTSIGLKMLPHMQILKEHFMTNNYFQRAVSWTNNCHYLDRMFTDMQSHFFSATVEEGEPIVWMHQQNRVIKARLKFQALCHRIISYNPMAQTGGQQQKSRLNKR